MRERDYNFASNKVLHIHSQDVKGLSSFTFLLVVTLQAVRLQFTRLTGNLREFHSDLQTLSGTTRKQLPLESFALEESGTKKHTCVYRRMELRKCRRKRKQTPASAAGAGGRRGSRRDADNRPGAAIRCPPLTVACGLTTAVASCSGGDGAAAARQLVRPPSEPSVCRGPRAPRSQLPHLVGCRLPLGAQPVSC